jgi:mercuric ion transport protein
MSDKRAGFPIIGGLVAAIGASLCCAGPFVLLLLGISGSWISSLTLLEPYRPLFLLAVAGFFGYAGWAVYHPVERCAPETACAIPETRKRRIVLFWACAFLALILTTSSYWIPLII